MPIVYKKKYQVVSTTPHKLNVRFVRTPFTSFLKESVIQMDVCNLIEFFNVWLVIQDLDSFLSKDDVLFHTVHMPEKMDAISVNRDEFGLKINAYHKARLIKQFVLPVLRLNF